MSNPIKSQDLYQPGPQDELKLLHARLAQLQIDIKNMTVLARSLKTALGGLNINTGNTQKQIIDIATKAEKLKQQNERTQLAYQRTKTEIEKTMAAEQRRLAMAIKAEDTLTKAVDQQNERRSASNRKQQAHDQALDQRRIASAQRVANTQQRLQAGLQASAQKTAAAIANANNLNAARVANVRQAGGISQARANAQAAIAAQRLTIAQNQAAASTIRLSTVQNQNAASAIRLAETQRRAAEAAERNKGSVTGLLGSIRNLVYAYASLGVVAQVFQSILKQTKALDTLTVAFNTTLGSTQATAQAQEYLLDISERFGTNLLGASQAYLKFSAASKQAGVSAKVTQDIFTSVTKASSILGLGAERTSYVFLALEQIMSKGRLSTEELRRQLGEHLPGAFGIAAQSIGVTTAKLTDMLKKGEIASTDFLPKFAKQLEIAYGIQNVERIDNLAAAQERFNNQLTLLVRDLDLSSALKDFFNGLAEGAKWIRLNIDLVLQLGKAVLYMAAAWLAWNIGSTISGLRSLSAAMAVLNKAMKANPVGVALVAFTALIGVIDLMTDKINGATISKRALNDAQQESADRTKDETIEIKALLEAYSDENTSNIQKENILKRLNEIGVKAIDLDGDKKISIEELTVATNNYISALRKQIEAEILKEKLSQLIKDRSKAAEGKTIGGFGNVLAGLDVFLGTGITDLGKSAILDEYDKAISDLEKILSQKFVEEALNKKTGATDLEGDGSGNKDTFDALKERLALILNNQDRELAELQLTFERKKADFIAHNEDITGLEDKYAHDRAEIVNKYLDIEIKAYEDAEKDKKEAFKDATDDVKKYLDQRRQAIEDAETKRKFNVDTLRDEFNARRKHEEEIFDLSKHSEEEIAAFKLKLKADELNDEIQLHRIFGKVLNDEELARAIELRDKLKAQFTKDGKLVTPLDTKSEETDIFSLLNINFKDDAAKQSVIDALDFAKGQLTDFLDFQKEIIDQEIENADRKVAAAENNLQRQIALAAANQANNVAGAQAELALAKKTQEDALKARQKFQKTELALNTALEASNLGVAIAKTLAAGLGVAGIALVAGMLAAFAAAKIKAFQLVNKKTFRKGGYETIGGGSHESGNDTHVGGNNWAEKDESVGIFTAKATRKYKPSLKAIVNAANKGTLENILVQDRRAIQGINMINKTDIDTSLMEKRLTRLVSLSEAKTFVDGKGRLVRIDRGRTTVIN